MNENLYYLFLSGLALGSGPCLISCAPFLLAYTTAQRKGIGASLCAYGIFSLGRILSYILWGLLCVAGSSFFHSEMMSRYVPAIYFFAGLFMVLLGCVIVFGVQGFWGRACVFLTKGNIRNVGVAGFLIGLAPCLPLIGIFNYVAMISRNSWEAIIYLSIFGVATIISPLAFFAAASGKFGKMISGKETLRRVIQYGCGGIIIFLGIKMLLGLIQ